MGLDVYLRRDIANVLRSTAAANLGATGTALDVLSEVGVGISQEKLVKVYQAAFLQALLCVGLGFGLEPSDGATVRQVEQGQAAIPSWVEINQ
jgi:hypothetical protein